MSDELEIEIPSESDSSNHPLNSCVLKPFNMKERLCILVSKIENQNQNQDVQPNSNSDTMQMKSISKPGSPSHNIESNGVSFEKDIKHEFSTEITSERLTSSFFERRLKYRTGIPTIVAKGRTMPHVDNIDDMADSSKLNPDVDEIQSNKIADAPVTIEIKKIEKQVALKMNMEKFILLFNNDYDEGIQYMIKSNLIDEKPTKIANLLLTTEGLSKEMIGKCLGSYKEKNISILQAYCELLDLRGLKFDHALRLFLSTFRLPGEAQQIERIVKIFASVYHKDNPKEFNDPETPFLLAYSLLMLNTDAHSDRINQKNKMTKQQFISNNSKVFPDMPKEYLEKMFDNIVKQKFETRIDYIETVYNRLHTARFELQGESLKNVIVLTGQLSAGEIFLKYGRKGNPHKRFVWISEKENAIFWKSEAKNSEKARAILFDQIEDIVVGCNTTKVLRKHHIPETQDPLFFSLITAFRTLDLKAKDIETRIKWEQYFRLLLTNKKLQEPKKQVNIIRKKQAKEKLSEIWKTEILANWEFYWNYENRGPKFLRTPQKLKSSPSNNNKNIRGLSQGFSKSKSKKQTPEISHFDEKIPELTAESTNHVDTITKDYYKDLLKNKNTLLPSIWMHGIPSWLRKRLWPLVIENRLEITENLYELLVEKANLIEKDDQKNSFKRIYSDSKSTFPNIDILHEQPKRNVESLKISIEQLIIIQQSLLNVLKAFVIYRPDIGYAKGMNHLAAILLLYLPEYEAFNCFMNLLHSHHFLSFYRGDLREIEWRIRFFEKYFKKELPFLFHHFKGLDLTSDMYLLEWFLSLFSANLSDIDLISRVWDCFFLEKEIFMIKFAIGLLKYFQKQLGMLTFDGAMKFLKKMPDNINEDELFDIIENINILEFEYENTINAQNKAKVNTQIHQALLQFQTSRLKILGIEQIEYEQQQIISEIN